MTEYVQAKDVKVGDIIWEAQEQVVTEVRHLSHSVAITAQRIGQVGPEFGSAQWLLENVRWVPVTITETEQGG